MDLLDNSLETGSEPSVPTLESNGTSVLSDQSGYEDIQTEVKRPAVFRYNRTALIVSALSLILIISIAIISFAVSSFLSHRNNSDSGTTSNNAQPSIDYSVGTLPVQGITPSGQLKVGQADQLAINGQLKVNNTLVLSPGKAPSAPVPGLIYYDQATKQPYYYNGSQFIGLAPTAVPQHVTSLGGAAGVVGLGEGLQVVGDELSVSGSLLQAAANAGTHTTGVTSVQGQKGTVTLTGGSGINVNGTTISNRGVLSLTGNPNQVSVSAATGSIALSLPQDIDTNADAQFNSLVLGGGDLTLASAAQINADSLSTINSGDDLALNADGNFTFTNAAGANSFVFPTSGGPDQVICTTVNTCGAGGGQNVLLEPTGVQTASANKTAIFINKASGTGDLIDLQDGGADALAIDNAGNTTIGKLSVTNGLTANSLTASTITNTSALTVGATSQNLTLQGTSLSIISTNGTNSTTVGFSGTQSPGNIAYNFDRTAAAGTYTICTTIGNCTGVGGGITGAGTANKLAEFTGSGTIGNSPLTDASGNLSSAGSLAAVGLSAGSGLLQGTGGLTITGATGINTTGTANTSIGNAGGTFAVVSSGLNVTTAGALSGISTISTSSTINGATIASTGINGATINSTSFNTATISGGSLGSSAVDGLGVSATAITPTGALTVGTIGQNLSLQGTGVSVTSSNGTNSTTVGFGGTQAAGNITYDFDQTAAAGTYTVCTTVGNCVGVGGGITGSGTNGDIAKFTGTGTIANSGLSESGTTLTYGGNAIVNAGAGFNGNLLNLEVNGGSKLAVDQAGNLTASGTINGATINSTSFNGATINSTSFNGAAINSTSFNTATISGGSLTGGSISAGTITGGTLSGTTVNGLGISATNITPTGALTVGTIGQSLTLQGNSVSTVSSNGTNTTTVGFGGSQAAGNITYNFDRTVAAGAYTICTTIGNCAGTGGGITGSGTSGDIAKFTGTGTIANSNLSESGTTLTYAGNAIVNAGPGFSGNLLNLEVNGGSKLSVDQAGNVTASGTFNTATISGGSLSSSAVDGLGVSGTSVTGTSTLSLASTGANAATVDTGGASTLNLGNTNATSIQVGHTSGTVPTLSLQGNTVSVVSSNGTNSTTVGFNGAQASGNIIYNFDRTVAAGSYTICTTIGNCAGSGGGITGSGTSSKLAEFTGSGTIGNSPLTDTGGDLSTSGNFAVQGGSLGLGVAGSANGTVTFSGTAGSHTVTLQAPSSDPASNLVFSLPSSYGNNGDCLQSDGLGGLNFAACPGGGGGGSGVTSLDSQTGILTLANSSGLSNTITIDDASTTQKGIAEFNSTNFSASAGTINTIQDIAATSSPKFATVNTTTGVNTGSGTGTQRIDASGNLVNIGTIATSGAINAQTISSSANFTGTLAVASTINGATIASTGINGATINSTSFNTATISGGSLTGTAVNGLGISATNITPTGALTVGATGQSLTLQGNAVSTVSTNGTNSTTVGFTGTQTAGNIIYNFDRTVAAGTYTICTTIGNCAGSGGGITGSGTSGKLAEFNGTGTITNSPLTDTSGNLSTAGSITAVGLSAGSGLLQGTGGLTLTGATSINTTGTANTSIGNSTGTLAIASSGLNVTTAGALTGITTIATSSTINGATIASTGINGATINSTSFNTATISGGSLTSTAVDGLNVSGIAISGTSTLSVASTGANALTLDTGGASTVNLGNTSATTIQIGHTTGTVPTVNIQGNSISIASSNGTNSTTVGFTGTQAAGNITYNFDRTVAAGAYTICTTIGNCAGTGGGITGSGTAGKLAEFNGTGTITNSPLTDTSGNLSTSGSLTAAGLSAGSGLLQGTGGITVTGAASINTTGTANTSIGNGTGTFALASSGLDVSTAGALTGITTIATSSTINGATISGGTLSGTAVNSLNVSGTAISGTGTLSVASTGANALTLDTGGASTVNLGNANATTIQIGHTSGTVPTIAIQGNTVSVASSNGTNSTTIGFTGAQAAGNIIYNFDRTVAAGAYTVCTTANNCNGVSGTNFYLQQVPTSNSANTAGADVISPTTNGISGLIVNGTTGTAATATSIVQGGAATALAVTSSNTGVGQDIELTNTTGTQTSGLLVNRNSAGGTTTNVVNVTNTAGTATSLLNLSNSATATNAIALSGTYTNLISSTNFTVSNAGAITLQGNQTSDITTAGAGTANKLTIQPGTSTTVSGTGANLVLDGGNQSGGTASTGGSLNLDAGTGVTNGAINIGSTNDAAIFLGKATGASTITVGQSTASNIINIGDANTATGNIQTINLGNGTEAGTGKAAITIGNLANASSTTIQSGSGNINLNVNQAAAGVVVKTITNNSAVALQVQNSSSNAVLTVDTSFNSGQGQLILGKASTNNGQLLFQSSGGTNTVGLAAPTTNPGSSYVLNLPTTAPGTSQCLESGASTATQLIFSSCGSSITLQGAYNTSAGAAPSIVLTGANKAVTIQNDNTTGITAGSEVFGVHANAASNVLGSSLFSVATSGDTSVASSDTTTGAALSVTTAVTGGMALNVTANSVSTTNAVNVSANGLTTGNGVNIATTSVLQSAGSLLNVTNTGILNNNGGTDTANLLNVSRAMSVSVSGGLATPTLDTGATGSGAIEFDNGTFHNGGSFSTASAAFTISVNTNRYLLVTIVYTPVNNSCTTDKPTVTYVTSMTFLNLDDDKANTSQCIAYYGMVAPSDGASHNIVVNNLSDDSAFGAVASSWFNVNQSTPTTNFSDTNSVTGSFPLNATSTSGQIMVDMLGVDSSSASGIPATNTSGQTALPTPLNDNSVFIEIAGSSKAASSSTTTMGWTNLVGSIWDEAAIGLNGSGSVGFETVAGAVASFSNSCTVSVGTCVDASNILSLNQQYASSTGTVLNIQNAGTGDLIDLSSGGNMVDSFSNNGTLTVGQSGGTSTPALVVLGGSTSNSDPAEVDGAMYYSTTMNAYRCGTNGFWSNCAVNNIQNSFNFTDDFLGGNTASATSTGVTGVGSLGWTVAATTSCSVSYNSTSGPSVGHDHPGVVQLQSGATSGNGCAMAEGGSSANSPSDNDILGTGDDIRFTAGVASTAHGTFRIGSTNTLNNTAPTSGVWFEYNNASNATHWRYCYGTGLAATCAATTDTVTAQNWYSFEIRIISSTAVTFIITPAGGSPEVHALTGITYDPGTANFVGPMATCYASSAATNACYVDYYQYTGFTTATGGR